MSESFNKLTPAEAERLAILAEECAETIQIVGKILRHGYHSWSPFVGPPDNRALLEIELGHIDYAKALLSARGDIDQQKVEASSVEKCGRIENYLHHQQQPYQSAQ